MTPVPVRAWVVMRVAVWIYAKCGRSITAPRGILPGVVTYDMIAIFGNVISVAQMLLQRSGGLIHRFRIPRRVARKTFVLGSHGVLIPTPRVPRPITFTHLLIHFACGI